MKQGKVINGALLLAVVALLGIFAASVRIRPTGDSVAVLTTAGITCGGCTTAIEKALQGKEGVAAVEVDAKGGKVVVGYDAKRVTPAHLAATLTAAGYRSSVAETMSFERFRAMTGRSPGEGMTEKIGCGGCCGIAR